MIGFFYYGHFGLGLVFVLGVGFSGVFVAVGFQCGDFSGVDDMGGVQIFGYEFIGDELGFNMCPLWILGGESFCRFGYLGWMLSVGIVGTILVLVVGGYWISFID